MLTRENDGLFFFSSCNGDQTAKELTFFFLYISFHTGIGGQPSERLLKLRHKLQKLLLVEGLTDEVLAQVTKWIP